MILPIIALSLLFIIFNMINYLVKEKYIIECFFNNDNLSLNSYQKKISQNINSTSIFTTGYEMKDKKVYNNCDDKPLQPNFGYNTWIYEFNEGQKLFNERYKPNITEFMPNYKKMYTMTGDFITDGPLPSNY